MRQGNILNEATAVSLATFLGEAIRILILIVAPHAIMTRIRLLNWSQLQCQRGDDFETWPGKNLKLPSTMCLAIAFHHCFQTVFPALAVLNPFKAFVVTL